MLNIFLIILGKSISIIIKTLKLGNGATWPGHIALILNKKFVSQISQEAKTQTILITGTNGKTTTSSMIKTVLSEKGKKVLQNNSGANLLNGIASTVILGADARGRLEYDYAIFEVDENAFDEAVEELKPKYIVILNLFRDQLDRYGEIDNITKRWKKILVKLPNTTTAILNGDDPRIAALGESLKSKVYYFGLSETKFEDGKMEQPTDASFCPKCGFDLEYKTLEFSHLGDWYCGTCGFRRPKLALEKVEHYPLPGAYNKYNTLAAYLVLEHTEALKMNDIKKDMINFSPVFGRQEEISYRGVKASIFLAKNPTSFNQSLTTIKALSAKVVLIVLNDNIPDGRDISWIWDIDMSTLLDFEHIVVSGMRAYDMGLRIKYEIVDNKIFDKKVKIRKNLNEAINTCVELRQDGGDFYILPNYSAMLEVRKILVGRKIL